MKNSYRGNIFGGGDTYVSKADDYSKGNSTGNVINGGLAQQVGTSIFYMTTRHPYEIRRLNTSTGVTTKIATESQGINVVNDTVYYNSYNSIMKVKDDGTGNMTLVNNVKPFDLNVYKGYVYFIDKAPYPKHNICRVPVGGGSVEKIQSVKTKSLNVVDNKIYYISEELGVMYKMDFDGSNRTKIIRGAASKMIVYRGEVFFSDAYSQGTLKKCRVDGTDLVNFNMKAEVFNVDYNYIYFVDGDSRNGIFRCNLDGSNKVSLLYEGNIGGKRITIRPEKLALTDDWIYFETFDTTSKGNLFRCKKDGSSLEQIE